MNKQIIIVFALFAMIACVVANEYHQSYYQPQYHTEEKKFISIPALKLKLGTDKLQFRLPNLMSLFQTHHETQAHYPQHY